MDSIQVIKNVSDYNIMNSIINWLLNINYGSIASIIGFLLSLYVAKNVYNVNRYLFIKKRLPQYLKNFESYGSTINQLAGNFQPNKEIIVDEITKCYSDTKNIRKKVPRILKPEINNLRSEIKKTLNKSNFLIEDSRNIYRQILTVTQSIENFQKDYQIER